LPPAHKGSVDSSPCKWAPRLSSPASQHSSGRSTPSCASFEASRWIGFPFGKSRTQGLATLSAAFVLQPYETFFSLKHSQASPFRAFLFSRGPTPLPEHRFALALFYETLPDFVSAPQRLHSHKKNRTLFMRPRLAISGRGLMLSWAFRPLRCSLPFNPAANVSFAPSPSRSWTVDPSQNRRS
jgi:hypothetical protein